MHCCEAYSSSRDSCCGDVQLKQRCSAALEQGAFDAATAVATAMATAAVKFPGADLAQVASDGYNASAADLHIGGTATKEKATEKPPPQLLRIGRYVLTDQVDNSGTTYKSVNIKTQEELVCKVINKAENDKILSIYYRLDGNEQINEVREVVMGETKTYLFLARTDGDLYSYVRTRRRLREAEAQRLFRQVAATVAFCHENGVVLRHLKLRKFVFKDADRTQLKLESLEDAVAFDDDDDSLCDKHGCPAYVSPELLTNERYSGCAADVWSMGVVLYTMLVGRYPFHDTQPNLLFARIRRGHLVVPEWLSSKARCLIRALLRPDPAERLTASDVLSHPWLRPGPLDLSSQFKYDAKVSDQTVPNGNAVSTFHPASVRSTK